MTASSTPSWKSAPERLLQRTAGAWLRRLVALLLCGWFGLAAAATIDVLAARLELGEEGYELTADFRVNFPAVLVEAINKGVTLHFVAEFELKRPRWYWFDKTVARRRESYRLSYHALTRQYRLTVGALHQNFTSLEDAARRLARLSRWVLIERGQLAVGEEYLAAVRLQLDTTQLPKPFQLTALANDDWELDSGWYRWTLIAGASQ